MLNSIISNNISAGVTFGQFLICMLVSMALGFCLSLLHCYRNQCSRNFIITLSLLPAVIQTVIMLVNGNLGTGVAVMGAFSLIRFRSLPGNSREIGSVFLAMAIGLATGMGYLMIAVFLLAAIGAAEIVLIALPWGKQRFLEKELKITIPEDLDYYGIFDDLFAAFTSKAELIRVKTVDMGSLYELSYVLLLKSEEAEKEFIDKLRCRNGNLPIVCGRTANGREEL